MSCGQKDRVCQIFQSNMQPSYHSTPVSLRFHKWFNLSLFNLCALATMGLILRSKMVFVLSMINYNHLLEAHSHFGLGGWATWVIMVAFVNELLSDSLKKKPVYKWLLGILLICAWGMLLSFLIWGYNTLSTITSICFVLLNYLWCGIFLRDFLKSNPTNTVKLLAISSLVCLICSTSGTWGISYIYFTKTIDAFLYRNALFTYLHFLYNGFFTLAVFALLFNKIDQKLSLKVRRNIRWFSIAMCSAVVPSLFITYLWQDPNGWMRFIAIIGSLLLLFCFCLCLVTIASLRSVYRDEMPVTRFLIGISLCSLVLKLALQSLTVFPVVGNAIFGNRSVIMGFLHMVFLGFVTLFMLAYFVRLGILDSKKKLTPIALYTFAGAVIINEVLLLTQGMANMLIAGSVVFLWFLWIAGIELFAGSVLILLARIQSMK
jgi:hypothetical protein